MAEVPASLAPNTEPAALPVVKIPDGSNHVPLLDHETQTVIEVPHEQLEPLLRSGRYTPRSDAEFQFVNPNGEAITLPAGEAYKALQGGWRLETQPEIKARETQQIYGDSEFTAAAAGAARGLTFGLSDQALTKSGLVKPETLAGLQEANPISSGVGEVAGVIAPALLTDGASLLAAGPESAALAGRATAKYVEKKALSLGLSNTVAKSIATKVLPAAAGSAVEGAFYGAGQLISEDALGKADFNAEALVGSIGTGALLGGAFGGVLAAGVEALAPVGKFAKMVAEPIVNKAKSFTDRELAASKVLDMSGPQFLKLKARRPDLVEALPETLQNKLGLKVTSSADELLSAAETLKADAGQNIGAVLKEVDSVLATRADLATDGTALIDTIKDKLTKDYLQSYIDLGIAKTAPEARSIQKYLQELDQMKLQHALGKMEGKNVNAEMLQKLKLFEDQRIKYAKDPIKRTLMEDMLLDTRTIVKGEIDALASRIDGVGGTELAKKLRTANFDYSISSEIIPHLEKSITKRGDRAWNGFTSATMDVVHDTAHKLTVLGKIEKYRQTVTKAVDAASNAVVTGTKIVNKLGAPVATDILLKTPLARSYDDSGKSKAPADRSDAYRNIQKNLTSFQLDPTALAEKVNKQTSGMYRVAPNTSGEVDRVGMAAAQFLNSKLPKRSSDAGMLAAYKPVKVPSSMELAKFERYLDATNSPMKVLKDLERGTVTREQTEALKSVYPTIFRSLQDQIMMLLPKHAATMPYSRKIQLGMLFDVPTDASLVPKNIMSLQSTFNDENIQQSGDGAVNTTQSGLKNLNDGDTGATSLDRLAADGPGGSD